jgi:hypothetical protein
VLIYDGQIHGPPFHTRSTTQEIYEGYRYIYTDTLTVTMCSNGRATPCGCRRNQITTPHTQLQETEQWSFQNALDGCNVILELAPDLRREIVRRGGRNVGISNIKPQCKHPNSSKGLNLQSFYDIPLNQTTPAVMIYSDIYTRPIIAIWRWSNGQSSKTKTFDQYNINFAL